MTEKDESPSWFASIAGMIFGEKTKEKIDSPKAGQLEWSIREAADQRGVFPANHSCFGDNIIYESSSVASAAYDIRRALAIGYGTHALYGGKGSGLTTTLHAAVRGRKLDGTVVGTRAIVFPGPQKAEDSEQWLAFFQEKLGKHWTGLSGFDTANKIVRILSFTKENFLNFPKSYDPNKLKDLSLNIYSLVPGREQPKSFKYKKQTNENRGILIGFDDIDYKGFLETLTYSCESVGIVLILATHNSSVANELLKLCEGRVNPMITSVKPLRDDKLIEDVHKDYFKLAVYRDDCLEDATKKKWDWDSTMRMGDDKKRKKTYWQNCSVSRLVTKRNCSPRR